MAVTTSPGLTADPLTMFSHSGIKPTTLTGSSRLAMANMAAKTLAAPPMSPLIKSMPAAGLIDIPPLTYKENTTKTVHCLGFYLRLF